MAAPSVVAIWNRALQLLGAARVQSTADTSKNAIACNACYEAIRDRLLETHPWRFAIKLASLAADDPSPDWGKANAFTLPSDFIDLAPEYEEDQSLDLDWEMQDGKIFTDNDAPLQIRYIAKVTDPSKMSPLFRELLATEMAVAMCEELTQSNTKRLALVNEVERVGGQARRANARKTRSQEGPESPWVTARRR